MEELFLIYVHLIGEDYKGNFIYEFIFSDTTKNIDGNGWDTSPASGRPEPPHEHFIKKVGKLETELKLHVISDSELFAVWDALDGVIALAWEDIDSYETYPKHRLCFKFGEAIKIVETELYEKDLILKYDKQTHGKEK
jgi:hypothetical protein